MERLTDIAHRNLDPWECCGQDKYCTRGSHEEGGCNRGCIVPHIYDKLALYEDTGLEPEDLLKIKKIILQAEQRKASYKKRKKNRAKRKNNGGNKERQQ